MLDFVIPLFGTYLRSDIIEFWLYPFFCLCFVSFVPVMIKWLFRWG